jgi:nitrile hydratase
MTLPHDLGGRPGFGGVVVEPDEPVFHEAWERTARALVYATAGLVDNPSTSRFRHTMERMAPAHYLTSSYYERWFTAAATLAVESGTLTQEELELKAGGPVPLAEPEAAPDVSDLGGGARRFAVGDLVRVRSFETTGHTRAPAYVRGRTGTVEALHGAFHLPDVEAHSARRIAEETYTVRFSAKELWGRDERAHVSVGLWDSYLEPA